MRKKRKPVTLNGFFKKVEREAKATYNKATGFLGVEFPRKPSQDILTGLKTRGFRWKPRAKRWSAKWSVHREDFAKSLAGDIRKIDITPNWAKKAEYASLQARKHGAISTERFDRT